MKRLLLLAAAAGVLGLSACETATPYQPLGVRGTHASGGYSENRLETNRFAVSFRGNSLTSRQTVEKYLLYRSADLTLQNGYDWFTTVDRHTERKDRYYGDSIGYGPYGYGGYGGGAFSPYWGLYRRGYGWGYGYGGYGGFGGFGGGFGGFNNFDIQQVSQYDASAEVVMGKGQKPTGDRRAFDAHQVVDNLRGQIQMPQA